jgi:hypothetical protein
MDAATLRELQAPLKQLYRDDPLTSRTPLEAEASFEGEGVTATVQTWSGPTRAGLHPATGGDGSDACSGDMLLQDISIVAELQTDADDVTLAKLGELTERYCVVGQSLVQMPSFAIRKRAAP